ncbi:MAG: hypothetical protein ACQEWG_06120, partial [Bacteroidota bacterium]
LYMEMNTAMKKILFLFTASLIFLSCSSFEEDHEIKEGVRKYLDGTLHDPESLEELEWTISPHFSFRHKDSLDNNSPFIVDYAATFNRSNRMVFYHVKLLYRAKNGFGAKRKSAIYATHIENGHLQFENAAYSYELKSFMDLKTDKLMEPRRLFLWNEFSRRNEGNVTMEDFKREYPEYD